MRKVPTISFIVVATFLSLARGATVDLSGQWRFAMDRNDEGIKASWFSRSLKDQIKLPGILQSQGYGDEISADTPWVLGLGAASWNADPRKEKYSQPGHTLVAFLSQPVRHYLGVAWYQRDIDIPADWAGKAEHLFFERAHWKTTVWIDDKEIGSCTSLTSPHEYELGILPAGKHTLTVRINNGTLPPTSVNTRGQRIRLGIMLDGVSMNYRYDGHSVSDALGATWNGIVGRIELRATSPVFIDDAQVFPNVEKKTATIKVTIGNKTGKSGSGTLTAGGATVPMTWNEKGGSGEITFNVNSQAQTWDEFHPVLQNVGLHLTGDNADDLRDLSFGLRQIESVGRKMVLNGVDIEIRGTHSGGDFPLTGYPSMDVDSWKKIIQTCKDYGLNMFRFHSWCPPEAAFTAADELGFYIQPECGMWNDFSAAGNAEILEDETARMERAYGNHPSYLLLSPSNEPAGRWQPVLDPWTGAWHDRDPRRLYADNTGRANLAATQPTFAIQPFRGPGGWFGNDYSGQVARTPRALPIITHEVGQWCAYPDFDVMKEFTGYLRPGNYQIFKDSAEEHGVLDRDHDFANASGKFQVLCYKEEIEANLRTPELSGYELLDLHDYLGQGTALIGVVDAFWKPKSYVTAEEYHRFAGPSVPLARMNEYVFKTSEKFEIPVEMAHYGISPIAGAKPVWKIVDLGGNIAVQGVLPLVDLPIGRGTKLGTVSADLSKLPSPREYKLVVSISDKIENSWEFWLYPATLDTAAPGDVMVTSDWKAATERLGQGGKVLFTPADSMLDNTSPPLNNVPVFWNREMNPKLESMLGLWVNAASPALSQFPTESFCDWQWTDIVRPDARHAIRAINIEKEPKELRPIVSAIDDWNRNYKLGVIFEMKIGGGKLLVCAADVTNGLENHTVARQLRKSLVDYMHSDSFDPKVSVSAEQADLLWPGPSKSTTQPAAQPTGAPPGDVVEGAAATRRTR